MVKSAVESALAGQSQALPDATAVAASAVATAATEKESADRCQKHVNHEVRDIMRDHGDLAMNRNDLDAKLTRSTLAQVSSLQKASQTEITMPKKEPNVVC